MMTTSLKSSLLLPDGCQEKIFACPGPRGELRGILAFPPETSPVRGGVVFSHGWSGNRCGPTGLLKELARAFAREGFVSLRFDFSGRGESRGSGLDASLMTMGGDLTAAVDGFRKQTGIASPVICGLCSGGNVSIGSLNRLSSLSALLLFSVYPFSDGDCFQRDIHRTWHFVGTYLRKACSPDNWRRLFQGQASVRNVLYVLFGHWGNRKGNQAKESGRSLSGQAPGRSVRAAGRESRSCHAGAPPEEHLKNLRSDLPVLMIYGSADPDAAAARKYFSAYAGRHHLPFVFHDIEQANHNFSSRKWRMELMRLSVDFLNSLEKA